MSHLLPRLTPIVLMILLVTAGDLVLPSWRAPALAAPSTCATPVALTNGDFESPVISTGSVNIMAQTQVPGWLTTASDKMIELWRGYGGVPAGSGSQHAELNANQVSTLYQDLATTPGQTLRWELKHRGRTGTDTMAVLIGAPGAPGVAQGAPIADGTTAWGTYSGVYTVPAGQTSTRFAFRSVASASSSPSIGNFLDAISFGSAACLVTTTTAATATADVGDLLTYTVTARNAGGNPARLVTISDDLPAGTTYVPGSLRAVTGSTVSRPTDTAGDDAGEYDPGTRTVRLRAGTGATAGAGGIIAAGDSRTLTYQVRVGAAAAGATLTDDAVTAYTDTLSGTALTSTSDVAWVPVAPAADLTVTAALTSGTLVAGRTATWTVTATGNGPSAATGVRLSAAVPAALTGVTATSAGGTCTVSGGTAECAHPSISAGAARTMTITGGVPAATPAGTRYTLAATTTDATFDPDTTDNAVSLSSVVTTAADLSLRLTAPANPVAGATARYTATVANDGPSWARHVVLTDPVPAGATYPAGTVPGGTCSYRAAAHTLECALADLAPGASVTATLEFVLAPDGGAEIDNAAGVTSSTPDPVLTDNTDEVQSHDVEVADLGVGLTLGAATARPGELIDYTVTVRNHGPSDAHAVAVNLTAPAGFTVLPDPGPDCTIRGCTIATLTGNNVPTVRTGKIRIESSAAAGLTHAITTVVSPTADTNTANDTDTASVTVLLDADLGLTQAVSNPDSPGPAVAGQRLLESLTVTNRGPTRAEALVLQEHIPAGDIVPAVTAGAGTCRFQGSGSTGVVTPDGGIFLCTLHDLAAAAAWQVTFTGAVAADHPGITLVRTAEVTADSPDPDGGDNTATDTITVAHRADLAVSQTTSTPRVVQTDPVRLRATVRNDGPSTARHVLLRAEPGTGLTVGGATTDHGVYDDTDHTWHLSELAPGATAVLDLTGVAHDTGTTTGTVRVASADTTDPDSGNDTATTTITVDAESESLSVAVTPVVAPAAHRTAVRAGDTIGFDYPVTNTGNVTMSRITLTTGLGGAAVCPATELAAGASMTCRAGSPYPVTQADVDAGHPIVNTAVVAGYGPGDAAATAFRAALADVPLVASAPALTVTVTPAVDPPTRQNAARAGDPITYRYTVANTGNVTLTGPAVQATRGGPVSCPAGALAPGATVTCTGGGYTVTAADVDAGTPITESAGATATAPDGTPVTAAAPGTGSVTLVTAAPALTVAITAAVTPAARQNAAQTGDTIAYGYTVTNNGNVTLDQITATATRGGTLTCPTTTLAAGASTTCSGDPYPVSRADLDAGVPIVESVTVTGRSPAGATVTFPARTVAVPVAPAVPALAVAVTTAFTPAAGQRAAREDDYIDYRYTVTNTGNVTLTGLTLTASAGGPVSCTDAILPAGATTTCTNASYQVTAADIGAGTPIVRTVTATGTGPGSTGTVTSPAAAGRVAVAVAAPALAVAVAAAVDPPARQNAARAGDTVTYTWTVTNNGNVTIDQIQLSSTRGGTVTCTATTLAAGAHTTCTGDPYLIRQADLDTGAPLVENATVTGRAPDTTVVTADHAEPVHLAPPAPAVAVTVTAAGPAPARAGDTITYTTTVTNTGNVTLTDLNAGTATCTPATLAVGATATCGGGTPYRVTAADIDAGQPVATPVHVSARFPGSPAPQTFGPFTDPVAVTPAGAALTLAVDPVVSPPARQDAAAAGDTVTYRYTVTNSGNVTLDRIAVTTARGATVTCPYPSLAAGASMTCTGGTTRVVTQADVDAGQVPAETATVAGRAPHDTTATSYAPVSAGVPTAVAAPALALAVTPSVPGPVAAGDTVGYSYRATNTGNVTVTALVVTDSTGALAGCPATTLAPAATTTCTAVTTHQVTPADIDAGTALRRTATATGRAPGGAPLTASAAASVPVTPAAPVLTLTTIAAATTPDTVALTYRAANTGNVTMSAVTVLSSLLGPATCAQTVLGAGAATTCIPAGPYRITAADVDAGRPVTDRATVSGRAPRAAAVTASAPAVTTVPVPAAAPELRAEVTAVVDPATRQQAAQAGDTVTYRYLVTNTGNVTMSRITVGDAPTGPARCPSDTLAAGASMTCTSTGAYRITPADVTAGRPVRDAAYVSGRAPGTTTASTFGPFTAEVAVTAGIPSLAVEVRADVDPPSHAGAVRVGDRVTYRYVVTNDGTVTMTDVALTDTTATSGALALAAAPAAAAAADDAVTCPFTTLAEGAAMTCTASGVHVVTQAEIDSGRALARTVAVSARAPGAAAPATFDESEADVPVVPAAPAITAAQHARWQDLDGDGDLSPLEPITSTIVVDNTGNVTLSGLSVTGLPAPVRCDRTVLPPGREATCASDVFHLTAAEIAAGAHEELARIAMFAPGGSREIDVDAPAVIVAPTHTPSPAAPTRPAGTPGTSTPARPGPARPAPSRSPAAAPAPGPAASRPGAGRIPLTGGDVVSTALAGAAALLAGLVLLRLARRRH